MSTDTVEHGGTAPEPPPGVTLLCTLEGHLDNVRSIAFDPAGRLLASGGSDKTIALWEASGERLLRTLEGRLDIVNSIAFDPAGLLLASGNDDKTVKLWETDTGTLRRTLEGHRDRVWSVAFAPVGGTLASAGADTTVRLWETASGRELGALEGHEDWVWSVAFDPTGHLLASGSWDHTVKLWEAADGRPRATLTGHQDLIWSVAFDPAGRLLASASEDKTVKLWEVSSGRLLRTLEGHTGPVGPLAFSPDGLLLASTSADGTLHLWRCDSWELVARLPRLGPSGICSLGLAFHPKRPLLAAASAWPDRSPEAKCNQIHLWSLNPEVLFGQAPVSLTRHYVNAKVVLVGDTGVGKTGLSLVLNAQPFAPTDSTAGRHVWTFDSREVTLKDHSKQIRETLLWDLAGQPGYRVIHQLHLNEVALALVVFDARSETDPLAGVRHWERALRLAHQRQGVASLALKKFLVSARNDRGAVSVSRERLQALVEEYGFEGYFETSAKEGWQVPELRAAIEKAIPWHELPVVTSSDLFAAIKDFLLEVKQTGRLLAPVSQLYHEFTRQFPAVRVREANLREQFDTCIGRLEIRDLIRRLSFGSYLLLQPELLDAYASAIVNTAKEEPHGLGSLAEDLALAGRFYVPPEQRIPDPGQEQLLLHATIEELMRHDLALRENAEDGRYLVFPSQFNREYEDASEPKGKTLAITFDGPVQSLYSTLTVRLGHSGLFTASRAEMWRNAAVFTARAGGKCGLYLQEFAEARGRLLLFFNPQASVETRFHFEEFVLAHVTRRTLAGSVNLLRFFVCLQCGEPVPEAYVKMLRAKGVLLFHCPCDGQVSLAEPKERMCFTSEVAAMDQSADRQRARDVFLLSANAETQTKSFVEWAGGVRVMLAIVFTDVVGATAKGQALGDEQMMAIKREHFALGSKLIGDFNGREIKTIGDSFLAAFHDAGEALDFALALQKQAGVHDLKIRAGIHIGPLHVERNDVFGGTVDFAARVVGAAKEAEIWLSSRAKEDIEALRATRHSHLQWQCHEGTVMKGFAGTFNLWSLVR